SSGQIINVVLIDDLSGSSVTAEISTNYNHDGTLRPGGSASWSRQQGALDFLVSLAAEPEYEIRDSFERSSGVDLIPTGTTMRKEVTDETGFEFNTNLSYDISPRDRIQFNALWQTEDSPEHIHRIETQLNSGSPTVTLEREDMDASEVGWEIGGNYEHFLKGGSRFRILAISTREEEELFRERFVRSNPGAEEEKDLVLENRSVASERIVRGAFTWNVSDSNSLELGAEVAQNILESSLFQDSPTAEGPVLPQTGGLPSLPIDNASADVEEIRYEPFAVHSWQVNSALAIESELVSEFSTIEQTGDINNKRRFDFLRPSLEVRYDPNASMQYRASIGKQVSQLSFDDFVASTDSSDEERDTEAGNPELRQEETWRYELNFEYRLPDDLGVINTLAYYEDISNVIDRVDLTPSAAQATGAVGNVGDAKRYGAEMDLSLRLGFVGLPDAIATSRLQASSSSVTDPVLGIKRRLERDDRGSASLGFRHDIPSQQLNYGFDLEYDLDKGPQFDVDRIEYVDFEPALSAYIQKTAFDGIVFRVEAGNILDTGQCRERRRFTNRTSDPFPSAIETNCQNDGRSLTLRVRNTF
ncbi:MAG: TonB-dependent receptor, partial [Pseudohongiella sp.]